MTRYGRFHGRIKDSGKPCEWPGCEDAGEFKAPRPGGAGEGPLWFCLHHVREYNANWDCFRGMSAPEIDAFRMSAHAWHRPTWKAGERPYVADLELRDPHHLFREPVHRPKGPLNRPLGARDRKALATLELDESATAADIRSAYKRLLKRYHPDTGREKGSAKRLQQVVEAFNQLASGLSPGERKTARA